MNKISYSRKSIFSLSDDEFPQAVDIFRGTFFFLSNMKTCEIMYEGDMYNSVEAAFQAAKLLNRAERAKFIKNTRPDYARRMGQSIKNIRADWYEVRTAIMYTIVKDKFTRNEVLKAKLLATKHIPLAEGNTWGDTFWGTVDGIGENHLGKILMQVRDELRQNTG